MPFSKLEQILDSHLISPRSLPARLPLKPPLGNRPSRTPGSSRQFFVGNQCHVTLMKKGTLHFRASFLQFGLGGVAVGKE